MVDIWKNKVVIDGIEYDINNYKINFKRKNVTIVLHEEEAYIKNITIPKVKGKKLVTLIRYEIGMNFKNVNSILYSYKINKEYKDKKEIIIYCINNKNQKIFKDIMLNNNRITIINLYQFRVLEKLFIMIREKNFIVCIYEESSVYFVCLKNNMPVCNVTVTNFKYSAKEFIKSLNVFMHYYLGRDTKMDAIYTINIQDKEMPKQIEDIKLVQIGN